MDPKTMMLINIRNMFLAAVRMGMSDDKGNIKITDTLVQEIIEMIDELLKEEGELK